MYFFNNIKSTYELSFASLFDKIYVHRIKQAEDGSELVQEIQVPLRRAGKMRWYWKTFKKFPDQNNISKVLPLMSWNIESMELDKTRQTNKFNQLNFLKTDGVISPAVRKWLQTCVPYKFTFTLSIWTKMETEMDQILEQILPFFPAGTRDIHIKEVPLLNVFRSVRLELSNVALNNQIDYADDARDRIIQSELSFVLDGYIYPPLKESAIIESVQSNIYIENLNTNYKSETLSLAIDENGDEVFTTESETEG